MLSYLPKLEIIDYAIEHGMLDKNESKRIEEGIHGNYMHEGSDTDKVKRRLMNTYNFFSVNEFYAILTQEIIL